MKIASTISTSRGETQVLKQISLEMTVVLFSGQPAINGLSWKEPTISRSWRADQYGQSKVFRISIERRRWLRFLRKGAPICSRRHVLLDTVPPSGGFLDGTPGLIYHFLKGFWFRFYVDACYYEVLQKRKSFASISKADI